MDATAKATCAPSLATSAAAHASPDAPLASALSAHASVEASSRAAVVAARRPPLGRPRTVAARPRGGGIAQPRRREPPASTATTDDSDDAGSGDTATPTGRNCPTRALALEEFIACVAAEITELVAAFQAQPSEARRFSTFKAQWLERRLSAMFQVEFWDSTPSDTHHAVLQVALELLEDAVRAPLQEDDASVWGVIGHWFALYCAFCVQVSEPKIKIAVNVVAWQSLTQLSGLLTLQLTVPRFAGAAREALAMLRRLEHEEDAFLRCLGGSVADFRLKLRSRLPVPVGSASQTAMAPLALPRRREEEMEDVVMQLEALSAQYNAALKQLARVETSANDTTGSSAPAISNHGGRGGGASRGRGRGRATPTFLRKSRVGELNSGTTSGSGSSFLQEAGLWSEQKATEHELWATRLRQSLFPTTTNGSDQHQPINGIVRRHRSSPAALFVDDPDAADDVDAALLALEQELEREEAEGHVTQSEQPQAPPRKAAATSRRPPTAQRKASGPATVSRPTRSSIVASSGQESDGLDELEAELARDLVTSTVAANTRPSSLKRAAPTVRSTSVQSRRRSPSVLSLDTESDGLADLEAELEHGTRSSESTKRTDVPTSRSVAPRATRSRAMSIVSTAEESDGLAELEAELTRETRPQRVGIVKNRAVAKSTTASAGTPTPRVTRSRALSIISTGEETDGLEELEAELARETVAAAQVPRPIALTSKTVIPTRSVVREPARVTRKRAFSIVSSGQESDGLTELEMELGRDPRLVLAPPAPQSAKRNGRQAAAQAQETQASVHGQPSDLPPSRPPRVQTRYASRFSDVSSVDELNLLQQELDASVSAAPMATPAPRKPAPSRKRSAAVASSVTSSAAPSAKRLATTSLSEKSATAKATPAAMLPNRRSRRLSDASSAMAESDAELLVLQAELATSPALQTAQMTATRSLTEPATSRARGASQQRLRSMSELSAMTESDEELKELQAELAKTTQVAAEVEPEKKTSVVRKPKEPRKRTTTTTVPKEKTVPAAEKPTASEKPTQKPKPVRKPRQPKSTAAKPPVPQTPSQEASKAASTQIASAAPSSALAPRTTRLSSRRSVASSYDSDGLDELENELRAFQ